MAIILEDTFANETGITKYTGPNGSVTNSANTEIIALTNFSNEIIGFYGNSEIASLDEEDNLFFSFEFNTILNFYVQVGSTRTTTPFIDLFFMAPYVDASNQIRPFMHNTQFGAGISAVINTRFYFLIIYGSERQAIYYNMTGWSGDLTDWTLFSTIPEGVVDVGSPGRFYAYVTNGSVGATATIYPYAFRESADLTIADAPVPTNPLATAVAFHTIRVTFTDNGAPSTETSVKIERSLTGGGLGFTEIGSVLRGVATFDATGLSPVTQYFFRLRSDFSFGAIHHYSAYTAEVNATTFALSTGTQNDFLLLDS